MKSLLLGTTSSGAIGRAGVPLAPPPMGLGKTHACQTFADYVVVEHGTTDSGAVTGRYRSADSGLRLHSIGDTRMDPLIDGGAIRRTGMITL